VKNTTLFAFIITILLVLEALADKARKETWLTITSFLAVIAITITVVLMSAGCLPAPA
jgi:hypothetical protein